VEETKTINKLAMSIGRPSITHNMAITHEHSDVEDVTKSEQTHFLENLSNIERLILRYTNYVFTGVFGIEMIIKIIDQGLLFGSNAYLKHGWNVLDGFIVIVSIVDIILTSLIQEKSAKIASQLRVLRVLRTLRALRWNLLDVAIVFIAVADINMELFINVHLPINPTLIRIMRIARIARVLKLLKSANGIRTLLDTIGRALLQVGNLSFLFVLQFFMFGVIGVQLFGDLDCSFDNPCEALDIHANFKNIGMACLTLFRIGSGDNWNSILKEATTLGNIVEENTEEQQPPDEPHLNDEIDIELKEIPPFQHLQAAPALTTTTSQPDLSSLSLNDKTKSVKTFIENLNHTFV
ncbi:unnamed protein product, partial [Didymodactylos carnosus]